MIPLPPKAEQDQIAKFLDNRLSKINRFIKAKKADKITKREDRISTIFNEQKEYPVIIVWEESFPSSWKMVKAKHILMKSI